MKIVLCDCKVKETDKKFRLLLCVETEDDTGEDELDSLLCYFLPGAIDINILGVTMVGPM